MPRFPISLSVVAFLFLAGGCAEQEPAQEMDADEPMAEAPAETPAQPSLDAFVGTWNAMAYMESGDTVPSTIIATADPDGWMVEFPERDPLPMRLLEVSGDSVVSEIGPYESLLRDDVMVTVRSVTRIVDGRMVGTMEAHYAGADSTVVEGRIEATRGM
ncbi:MAG: hypothetical protein R3314_13085 [Longimicrobiales bacterium]|nr:hypothetical protein [Longimicrobiales bacterium]